MVLGGEGGIRGEEEGERKIDRVEYVNINVFRFREFFVHYIKHHRNALTFLILYKPFH